MGKSSLRVRTTDFRVMVTEFMEQAREQVKWLKLHADETDEWHDGVTAQIENDQGRLENLESKISELDITISAMLADFTDLNAARHTHPDPLPPWWKRFFK